MEEGNSKGKKSPLDLIDENPEPNNMEDLYWESAAALASNQRPSTDSCPPDYF